VLGYQNCRFTFRTVFHRVGRPICHPSKLVLYSLLEMLPSNIKLYFVKRISQPWIVILRGCVVGTNDSEGCSENGASICLPNDRICPQKPRRWMQNAPLKLRYPPTKLHGVTSQNASTLKMDAECSFEETVSAHGTTRCHKPERFNPEDGCRMPLWNDDIRPRNYTVSQDRTLQPWRWMQNAPLKRRYPHT
jgi:hypothetical protein